MEPLGSLSESSPDIIDTSDQRLVNELENTPKADVSNSVERSDKKLTSATSPKGHILSLAPQSTTYHPINSNARFKICVATYGQRQGLKLQLL